VYVYTDHHSNTHCPLAVRRDNYDEENRRCDASTDRDIAK
jgi:hypothetical protein